MVVGQALDNLKDKPHDEKKMVAGSIAIAVVVILLVGWAFFFLRNIQRGSAIPTLQGAAVPEDQLNTQFIQQTQQQMNQYYDSAQQQLRDIRDTSAGGSGSVDAGAGVTPNGDDGGFGAQNNDF
ncbi:MAG: hypothetical protein WA021_01810 [Minisyncoccia bacterium]